MSSQKAAGIFREDSKPVLDQNGEEFDEANAWVVENKGFILCLSLTW